MKFHYNNILLVVIKMYPTNASFVFHELFRFDCWPDHIVKCSQLFVNHLADGFTRCNIGI